MRTIRCYSKVSVYIEKYKFVGSENDSKIGN